MSTYVQLALPTFLADTVARIRVVDIALNPAACRGELGFGHFFGGEMETELELRLRRSHWTIVTRSMISHATTVCSRLTPEEQERGDRIAAEDSAMRSTPSPIAGTWRYVIRLPSGDSAVIFSRTQQHPMTSLRAWRRDDVSSDTILPINGYTLMAVCTLSEGGLPLSYGGGRATTCYHSASAMAVSSSEDSATYRGDSSAELAAWIALQGQPIASELRTALTESARDSMAYYLPGYWTTYSNGNARFDWTISKDGRVLAVVSGRRVSSVLLAGHSR